VTECARDAEENKENAKREFGSQKVAKERLRVIYSRPFDNLKKEM